MKLVLSALIVLAGFAATAQDVFDSSVNSAVSNNDATYDAGYDVNSSKRDKKQPRPIPTPHQPCGPGELYPCL